MDPILVIRELKGMIYHMHAKDIRMDPAKVRENSLINTAYFDEPENRSWNFRTVGYSHGLDFWRNIYAELRANGYDYVTSIEMECDTLTASDGVQKAAEFLRMCVPKDLTPEEKNWKQKIHDCKVRHMQEYGL